jgi:hypothetical protein
MSTEREISRVLGEISSDVKHILIRQDKQDVRIERLQVRLTAAEAFQWKLTGIALTVPTVVSTVVLSLKYILPT